MSIQANLKEVLSELPAGVRLVAVSKFHPNEALEEAYAAGQRIFGESHVQEMKPCPKTLNGISSATCKQTKSNTWPLM